MNKVCYSRRRITRRINGCDLRVNPRTTVSATAPHMRLGNQHAEPLILFGTSRRSPLPPSVIPSARHAEPRALFCHGIAGLPRLDERVFHSLCLAKKTAAFFNSSRSMRSSRFSLRSRDSSSTSLPAPSLYSGVNVRRARGAFFPLSVFDTLSISPWVSTKSDQAQDESASHGVVR